MVVTHRNIDKLIDRFIENGNPYYAIVTGSGIHNKNESESDIENAADKLKRFLSETEGSEASYTINTYKVVPPKGGIKKNSEADIVLTYKAQKYSPEEKEQYRSNNSYFQEKVLDTLQRQAEEIAELRMQRITDEQLEEEAEPVNPYMGAVSAIFEHPITQQYLPLLLSKLFNTPNTQPMQLAGTQTQPQKVTIEQILETLFQKGVTIEHLYKLSQFDQSKIQMLLTML